MLVILQCGYIFANMFQSKFVTLNIYTAVAIFFITLGVIYNGYPWYFLAIVLGVYLLIVVLGVIKIQWNFFLTSVNKIPILFYEFKNGQINLATRNKQVVLSFDDGPHTEFTAAILDILKKENVPAVFFIIGEKLENNQDLGKRIFQEGHQIGNHTYNHGFNFDWQSSQKMQEEIIRTNELIESITGGSTKFFRPPYGVTNPNVAKAVRNLEMTSVGWHVRSLDTIAKNESDLLSRIIKKTKSGSIILLHDTCAITVKILPKLIHQLRQKGYEFIKLP